MATSLTRRWRAPAWRSPMAAHRSGISPPAPSLSIRRQRFDENSICRIYSMTKPVTGIAAMLLVEDGRLSLDQPVADVLPEFRALRVAIDVERSLDSRPATKTMTMRHLLTHTSGLASWTPLRADRRCCTPRIASAASRPETPASASIDRDTGRRPTGLSTWCGALPSCRSRTNPARYRTTRSGPTSWRSSSSGRATCPTSASSATACSRRSRCRQLGFR